MDTVVNDLMQTLRDHRLRVSPAESIDTLNALQNTGSGERETVKDSLRFSASEQRETGVAVRRIARRIRGAKTRRLKEDRIGRISAPHTLRHNVRYESVPFDPVLRRKGEGKPCVALLCDISLNTRNLARFWLHMIYQMQSLFSKVRTFVFVADVAEVTQVLEEYDMNRAVDEIFSGRVIDADVNSNFGKAAGQFRDQFLPTISHPKTVEQLGGVAEGLLKVRA